MVDVALSKHRVVLELRLAEWGGVAGNDDQLGLSVSQGLEGRLVAENVLAGLHYQRQTGVDGVSGLLGLLGRCYHRNVSRSFLGFSCCGISNTHLCALYLLRCKHSGLLVRGLLVVGESDDFWRCCRGLKVLETL